MCRLIAADEKILTFPTGERRRTNHSDLPKKNFNAHKPYDCPDRQILPRPDPPAARAIRSAVRTVRRLEHQDQRDLAQGFRPTLPAARAALALHRQGLPLRPGSAGARRGCGGGFPSVPLAILFPEAHFTAVDSIGKKIKVVQGVAEGLGLANLTPLCAGPKRFPNGTTMWFPAP